MTPPPGPKEAQQRANGEANRKRKLIAYAGKEKGGMADSRYGSNGGSSKPKKPRAARAKLYGKEGK